MIIDKFPSRPPLGQERYSVIIYPGNYRTAPPYITFQSITKSTNIRSQYHYGMTYFIDEKNEYVGYVRGNWWSGLNFLAELGIYDSNNKHLGTLTITLGRKIEVKNSYGSLILYCRVPLISRRGFYHGGPMAHGAIHRVKILDANKNIIGRIRGSTKQDWLREKGSTFTLDFSQNYPIMFGIGMLLKTFGSVIKISEIF